jgi:hypothetical protein
MVSVQHHILERPNHAFALAVGVADLATDGKSEVNAGWWRAGRRQHRASCSRRRAYSSWALVSAAAYDSIGFQESAAMVIRMTPGAACQVRFNCRSLLVAERSASSRRDWSSLHRQRHLRATGLTAAEQSRGVIDADAGATLNRFGDSILALTTYRGTAAHCGYGSEPSYDCHNARKPPVLAAARGPRAVARGAVGADGLRAFVQPLVPFVLFPGEIADVGIRDQRVPVVARTLHIRVPPSTVLRVCVRP